MACTNIDWSSFTFVAGTSQTLVSATELTATNGTAIFNPATLQIEYEVDTQNCDVDAIRYTVADLDGNVSNEAVWMIDYEIITAPVATADNLTIDAGETDTLDVAANDTGSINLLSYEVVTAPTYVTVTNNNDGTFQIYAPEDSEGADSFTYRFYDPNGIVSNTATVSITIQNAGTGTSSTICGVAGVDLTSFLSGSVTAGGSWSASGSNPSSPSIGTPTSVDFSSANSGVYEFTYTIGTSTATITLTLPAYGVAINSVSTPTSNPIASSITSVVTFTTVGVTNINNIEIEVDVKSGTNYDYYPPDTWNATTGVGTVTIEYADGVGTYDITVTATDSCGDSQTDSWATITIVA